MPLFNAEVNIGKPKTRFLTSKAPTVQMSIRSKTLASQLSTNSSYIELSFTDKDHYLRYQWSRAVEVSK